MRPNSSGDAPSSSPSLSLSTLTSNQRIVGGVCLGHAARRPVQIDDQRVAERGMRRGHQDGRLRARRLPAADADVVERAAPEGEAIADRRPGAKAPAKHVHWLDTKRGDIPTDGHDTHKRLAPADGGWWWCVGRDRCVDDWVI